MFISMLNFSSHVNRSDSDESTFVSIRQNISAFSGVMISDVARANALAKIVGIIEIYNEKMSAQQKRRIANEIYEMSLKYENLDIDLICATITHESALTWRPNVVSPVGAVGLMQIMP
jgi:hypothetical protein